MHLTYRDNIFLNSNLVCCLMNFSIFGNGGIDVMAELTVYLVQMLIDWSCQV
jgi:hypothetical protein